MPPGVERYWTTWHDRASARGLPGLHGAVVAVDAETGAVELLDLAAEDCGTMVNPMLVEGQIRGGVVQGIGTALHEEIPYDAQGQPLAATFLDYHMPGAQELPSIRIGHLHTPATATEYGMKGMGEGGAVAPPAAIANAVRARLAPLASRSTNTADAPAGVTAIAAAANHHVIPAQVATRPCST
jgi:carbon-monoxide dehydrogenase large subunit